MRQIKGTLHKPLMLIIKRRGPIIEPRGTLKVNGRGEDLKPEMTC